MRYPNSLIAKLVLGAAMALCVGADSARCESLGEPDHIFSDGFETFTCLAWSYSLPADCFDCIRNGDETDVDCGGLTCAACQPGEGCNTDSDCADLPAWTQAFPDCEDSTCSMGCSGENYDVNNDIVDGCEVVDSPLGNHTPDTAAYLGSFPCFDASVVSFKGKVPSDQRGHASPPVGGFNEITGSTPDHLLAFGDGGLTCSNDISMTLIVFGSSNPTCYRLTVTTNLQSLLCNTSAAGSCALSCGSGCYGEDTNIQFKVEKTCPLPVQEAPTYTVSGHL